MHAAAGKGPEALPGGAAEAKLDRAPGKSRIAVPLDDGSGHSSPDREVMIANLIVSGEGQGRLEIRLDLLQNFLVQRDDPGAKIPFDGSSRWFLPRCPTTRKRVPAPRPRAYEQS